MNPHETDYDYDSIIEELLANDIDVGNAYIYKNHPLNSEFDAYFQYCQKNLAAVSSMDGFNIQHSRFYFTDNKKVSARSYPKSNGYFRISVERETVQEVYDLFCGYNNVLEDPALIEYKNLSDLFKRFSYPYSLDYIIFQHSVLFIYFHELGHLIQYGNYESLNKDRKGHKALNINEELYEDKKFDIMDHVLEIDADLKGADYLGKSVVNIWLNLPLLMRTESTLKNLVVIALVGALSFFIMVDKFPITGIYYRKKTHPHPLIRLMWISDNLINAVKTFYPSLDSEYITNEALRVLNVYSNYKHLGDIYENYIKPYVEHSEDISDYLYSIVETSKKPEYKYLSNYK